MMCREEFWVNSQQMEDWKDGEGYKSKEAFSALHVCSKKDAFQRYGSPAHPLSPAEPFYLTI